MDINLQFLNLLLSGATFIAAGAGLIAYGKLIQKVETHEKSISKLWERYDKLSDNLPHAEKH